MYIIDNKSTLKCSKFDSPVILRIASKWFFIKENEGLIGGINFEKMQIDFLSFPYIKIKVSIRGYTHKETAYRFWNQSLLKNLKTF